MGRERSRVFAGLEAPAGVAGFDDVAVVVRRSSRAVVHLVSFRNVIQSDIAGARHQLPNLPPRTACPSHPPEGTTIPAGPLKASGIVTRRPPVILALPLMTFGKFGIRRHRLGTPTLMNMRVTVALAIALAVGVPAHAAQRLFGADGAAGNPATNLYVLDPTNGAIISTTGPIGFAITGLAFDRSTGVLYGSTGKASPTSPRSLVRIDTTTGAGTLIGSFGVGVPMQTMADLTFFNGTLYGSGSQVGDLYAVNATTGLATLIGGSGRTTFDAGNALAADNLGNFFAAGSNGTSVELFSVNLATGVSTLIAPIIGAAAPAPTHAISALAFNASNTLFGADVVNSGNPSSNAFLLTIDTTTGAAVILGQTVNSLDAIVFEPALTETHGAPALSVQSMAFLVGLMMLVGAMRLCRPRLSRPPR